MSYDLNKIVAPLVWSESSDGSLRAGDYRIFGTLHTNNSEVFLVTRASFLVSKSKNNSTAKRIAERDHAARVLAAVPMVAELVEALAEIQIAAFRQTDIGENHAAGLSGINDRNCFFRIRDKARAVLAKLEATP